MGLLLYSHIPTGIVALLFGSYVLVKAKNLTGALFFSICFIFAFWCLFDLSAWFAFLGSANTMFTWSLLDFLAVLMFFFSYYFLYVFVTKHDLPSWQKILALVVMLPTAVVTFFGLNLSIYDSNVCAAIENESLTRYTYYAEALFILASAVLTVFQYHHTKEKSLKNEILLAGTGVLIFLLFFFSATLLVSLLAGGDASLYVYNYLIYGLFGMPIFLAYFGYLIVRYHIFNLKIFGAQVLVAALVILIGSEFTFINSFTNQVLVAVTLILVAAIGLLLIRSVKREIEQKECIEGLAKNLEISNEQLSEFMSLATHEIRNPATFIRGFTAGALEGDLGELAPAVKDGMQKIFVRANDIIHLGNQYLNKSKIELNQLKYEFAPLDIGKLTEDLVREFQSAAAQQGITISSNIDKNQSYEVPADSGKIKEVIGNLIDNSVKYTKEGSVTVSIAKDDKNVTVKIADTGVGIPAETIPKLFKKFSRADAEKANILGTGLGLYLAKIFTDAHHGRIWVESGGEGKGSTFFVELPVSAPA